MFGIRTELANILTGYFHGSPENRAQVVAYPDWKNRARAELDRRATRFLDALPSRILDEIASGRIDLAELAAELPE